MKFAYSFIARSDLFLPSSYSPCLLLTMLVTPLPWLLELLLTATLSLITDPLASVRLVSGQIFFAFLF